MSAPILDVADEVVETINDAALLGTGITATRKFNPIIDLKNICERRCIVYPARNVSETDISRRLTAHEYEIQILVQEKLCQPDSAEWTAQIESLTAVVDSIAALFRGSVYLATTKCYASEIDVDPVFVPDHIDRLNLFTSVITLILVQARND